MRKKERRWNQTKRGGFGNLPRTSMGGFGERINQGSSHVSKEKVVRIETALWLFTEAMAVAARSRLFDRLGSSFAQRSSTSSSSSSTSRLDCRQRQGRGGRQGGRGNASSKGRHFSSLLLLCSVQQDKGKRFVCGWGDEFPEKKFPESGHWCHTQARHTTTTRKVWNTLRIFNKVLCLHTCTLTPNQKVIATPPRTRKWGNSRTTKCLRYYTKM